MIAGQSADCPAEPMDAEDPLFVLYTSGSTGKPKGIIHTTGGYLVGTYITTKYVFDLHEDDIYWCTADVGWITGHSYVVYGPLANGATTLMYEGAPNFPDFSPVLGDDRAAQGDAFSTPRPPPSALSCEPAGELVDKHDLSSLRLLGTVGEPINPEAWMWYHEVIGHGKCPIVDTWWQTETGAIMITPLPGVTPTKPGTATLPFFGVDAAIVDRDGKELGRQPGRAAGHSQALAVDAARHLQRSRSLRQAILDRVPGILFHRRRRPPRRRRIFLDHGPRG